MSATQKIATELVRLAIKEGWIQHLTSAMFKKKHRFLVLGTSGVGKSNLLESLTTLTPGVIDHMNRTEFAESHHLRISSEPFIFVDTPGQDHHASRRVKTIREEMTRGLSGIINVVAYGYHETREGKAQALTPEKQVRAEYLDKFRKAEVDRLQEWTAILGHREIAKLLITVITKADLWWNVKDHVFSYYQYGPYFEGLGDAKTLNPVVLHYCSVFHKFYGEGNLSGSFDEGDQQIARAGLIAALLSSVGRSSSGA